ncbi:MAG TPA: glycosyltransferase, partial [Sulfuricurvum sp.]|nr:glycosyltransferase [Sulfuricurvum sp.]
MKKLALFVPTLHGGGAERVMVNLASGLVSLGYNVNLIVADTHGVFLSQIDPAVHIIDLKQPRVLFALPKLIGYLIKEKPIGLISALDYANIIAIIAGRLTQVPVVISEHSTHSNALENVTGIKAKILPYLMQFFYPNAHAVVAVSDGVAKDLSSALKLDIRTISVIPNPVITSDLPLKAAMIPKHPWLANKTVPLILAVGRLSPPKDFSTLLHAFSLMIHTRDAKLIILGEGEDRSPLEQL